MASIPKHRAAEVETQQTVSSVPGLMITVLLRTRKSGEAQRERYDKYGGGLFPVAWYDLQCFFASCLPPDVLEVNSAFESYTEDADSVTVTFKVWMPVMRGGLSFQKSTRDVERGVLGRLDSCRAISLGHANGAPIQSACRITSTSMPWGPSPHSKLQGSAQAFIKFAHCTQASALNVLRDGLSKGQLHHQLLEQ